VESIMADDVAGLWAFLALEISSASRP